MLKKAISELWNISRTALSTQDSSLHSRMIYIKNELLKSYPSLVEGMTTKVIWFKIEDQVTNNLY